MIRIQTFTYIDVFASNSYLISDENGDAVIIDFGFFDKNIFNTIKDNKLKLKAILLTHGHFDHICGLKDFTSAPIYLHKDDIELLFDPNRNVGSFFNQPVKLDIKKHSIHEIKDNQVINILNTPIKVIHTPYHTKGSVCFYFEKENSLFSGDTLFCDSIGRFDLPTSDFHLISSSLKKIYLLPNDIKIFPGHGKDFIFNKNDLIRYIKMP